MSKWEYDKIDLNDLPSKAVDLDLLNDAGRDGWELVAITPNSVAYLRRPLVGVEAKPRAKPAKA